ncbi:hypothetical protein F3Y22_tig00110114pilonHSYRG00450 [Hibiscus syriacus]|uniref:Uncharacterized protein n=1 Tax=Hibiscus syriacus TaxID=106335 RepID=A0A6A3BNG4_HIBSY|nr:hypothetical protein F3Y22_tig00110114pilonHSYRG00450 [Hibiscus syriacus]
MKLLGWIHRKYGQYTSQPLRDFTIGKPSFDDQQFYSKPNYGTKSFRPSQSDRLRKSFGGVEAAQVDEEDNEEDTSSEMSELFHGFFATGTLGSDPNIPDPSTPTFAISVVNITEKETKITENELRLINDELEKFLGEEAKEEGCNDSSARNSFVSTGRSSHCSTISGRPTEVPDTNGDDTQVCPLRGYLSGSAIELSETTTVAKKEHGTSLGELFHRTKIAEEKLWSNYDDEKRTANEGDKSTVHIMKKKLLNAFRSSTAAAGGNIDSASAETKLHKILHMFNKKVEPESSTTTYKHGKPQKNENKEVIMYDVGHMLADDDIMIYPQRALSKNICRYKSLSKPPQFTLSCNHSNGNRECWVKTDADYLVLEL